MRKVLRRLSFFVLTIFLLTLIILGMAWGVLRLSVPRLKGTIAVHGISEEVEISFDEWGVPFVEGSCREDISYALGYLHGAERFFQMDMSRRFAAGEVCEIIGKSALWMDKAASVHEFRKRAKNTLKRLPADKRRQLEIYAKGVNAGLDSLTVKPFEYFLLRSKPVQWLPEDSLLLAYAFYMNMQDEHVFIDRTRDAIRKTLPSSVAQYFLENGNVWDASLDGFENEILEIPPASAWAYLKQFPKKDTVSVTRPDELLKDVKVGSNNWAVSPEHSENGHVMVANDPHLSVSVPGSWYKASYAYPDPSTGERLEVHGFTLPGQPAVVIGQNNWTSWGFTVAYIDHADLVELEIDPENEDAYLTDEGVEQFLIQEVMIQVKGGDPVAHKIKKTPWAPVIANREDGYALALKWDAHHEDAITMDLYDFERARNVDELLLAANRTHMPVMNIVAGDVHGNIGWSYFGFTPEREKANNVPLKLEETDRLWSTYRQPEAYPRIVNPKEGVLWTANNQVVNGKEKRRSGIGSVEQGARAFQIRENLRSKQRFSMDDMTAYQHDIEAKFMMRWRDLIIRYFDSLGEDVQHSARFEQEVRDWIGLADSDSIGYWLIRDFRRRVLGLMSSVFWPCEQYDPAFHFTYFQYEEPLFRLIEASPDFIVLKSEDRELPLPELIPLVIEKMSRNAEEKNWKQMTWGDHNRVDIQHPLARAVPQLAGLLNMPRSPSDGGSYTPKVVRGSHLASFRYVGIPGDPKQSVYQMTCGQSGHPLSPHYRDLQRLWITEEYLPMFSEDPKTNLVLIPKDE